MSTTYVITEAGSCHDGDFQQAKDMIAMARDCGAQAIKYQFWSDANLLADRRRVPQYYRDFYRNYALPGQWIPELELLARTAGIDFMCTAFLPNDVAALAPYVAHFKVSSFEAAAQDLIDAHLRFMEDDRIALRDRWLIMSRGMGASHASGVPLHLIEQVRFLLCTSAYPAPANQLNLRRFHLSSALDDDVLDGLSDHSDPSLTWTGALAVSAGAEIVEAHLRHQRTNPANPDFPHAMNWPQFRDYVRHVRFAEAALGDGRMRAQPSEAPMMAYRSGVNP